MKNQNYFLCCLFFFVCGISLQAQLVVNAGADQKICPGISVGLGGAPTASGTTGTVTYSWSPNYNINNTSSANPTAYPNVTTTYTVSVRDGSGSFGQDQVTITVVDAYLNAGNDTTIQQGQTIHLHAQASGNNGIFWTPVDGHIYNQNTANPDVFPSVTTTYHVTAIFGNCTVYDEIVITVIPGTNLFFYNTFTPNGDNANDFFYIGNIDKFPDNVLEIYNRYGQKVFNKTGYINDWDGKYLNEELPAGTYFYILDTKSEKGGKYKGCVTIVR